MCNKILHWDKSILIRRLIWIFFFETQVVSCFLLNALVVTQMVKKTFYDFETRYNIDLFSTPENKTKIMNCIIACGLSIRLHRFSV